MENGSIIQLAIPPRRTLRELAAHEKAAAAANRQEHARKAVAATFNSTI